MTTLSVIVPTIPGRESLLTRCLHSITEQTGDYEVIVVAGTAGLGTKYNAAVCEAVGDYVTNVDDDDWLAACYMDAVIPVCMADPDYVGLKIVAMVNGRFGHIRATSGEAKTWPRPADPADKVYPTQLTVPKGVTRRGIAAQVVYGDHNGADHQWAKDVSKLVHSWLFVDRCLYMYDYWHHTFGEPAGRDVGEWPFDESKIRRLEINR